MQRIARDQRPKGHHRQHDGQPGQHAQEAAPVAGRQAVPGRGRIDTGLVRRHEAGGCQLRGRGVKHVPHGGVRAGRSVKCFQGEVEAGAGARCRLEADAAAMALHDAVYRGQTDAGALELRILMQP